MKKVNDDLHGIESRLKALWRDYVILNIKKNTDWTKKPSP